MWRTTQRCRAKCKPIPVPLSPGLHAWVRPTFLDLEAVRCSILLLELAVTRGLSAPLGAPRGRLDVDAGHINWGRRALARWVRTREIGLATVRERYTG